MKKNNRKCIVCGTQYHYCNSCAEHMKNPVWMNIYHNENCKNLFTIASDYLNNVIDSATASEKFKKCDLSYKNKLHSKIKQAIDETKNVKNETENENVVENAFDKDYKSKAKKKNLNSDYNEGV